MYFKLLNQATKYRQDVKKRLEDDFKEGGQRNWLQVTGLRSLAIKLETLAAGITDRGAGFR